jgi:hypothetical protein
MHTYIFFSRHPLSTRRVVARHFVYFGSPGVEGGCGRDGTGQARARVLVGITWAGWDGFFSMEWDDISSPFLLFYTVLFSTCTTSFARADLFHDARSDKTPANLYTPRPEVAVSVATIDFYNLKHPQNEVEFLL